MNFEQIQYVKTIYETESMIRSAELLHISQSALSQSLANLEHELGYKIFKRSRKGTYPTDMGNTLLPYILDIYEAQQKLETKVRALDSKLTGTLKIATIPTLFHQIVPRALSEFKKDYPHIEVQVEEDDRDHILQRVENQEVDIGLVAKRESENFKSTIVDNDLNLATDFKLIVPLKSKLSFQSSVSLQQIQNYPFVLFDRNLYQHSIKQFEAQHGRLQIVFRTNNPGVLIRTVSEGLGLSIISSLMLENDPFVEQDLIDVVPMGEPFNYHVFFTALTHANQPNDAIVKTFIQYLRQ
ncbi:LysR family transcriptional regulator [Staphylococcus pettenkoferi]|uniref:LysR family transcriptional regulator n=1 Tax=Staphylococcus pettenkoferi TaxID=170573 RepID=UPI0025573AB1|nr:LysR family transcriptional regulator [Staphylococcus pettenkoferi]MDK7114343.1 LysR family transcriptional regulator [Staphylococcus pettenkoferi]